MKYDNVKLRYNKSPDSAYHVIVYKYSAGRDINDAQNRARKIGFNATVQDSLLNISSGLTIDRNSKFRGQGVVLEIQIPVGKQIRFDPSVRRAFNPWVIRRHDDYYRDWSRRNGYREDWDYDEYFRWEPNVDYTMDEKGKLVDPNKIKIQESNDEYETQDGQPSIQRDSLQRKRLEQKRMIDSINKELKNTDQKLREKRTGMKKSDEFRLAQVPCIPIFI